MSTTVPAILWESGSVLKSIESPITDMKKAGRKLLNDETLAKEFHHLNSSRLGRHDFKITC